MFTANHGMEDVEVGHNGGDAVELVHQRRIHVVEKLGAHCGPALQRGSLSWTGGRFGWALKERGGLSNPRSEALGIACH